MEQTECASPIIRQETLTPSLNSDSDPELNSHGSVAGKRRHRLPTDSDSDSETPGAEEECEPWEEEMEDLVTGERTQLAPGDIRSWRELRDQIKNDLNWNRHTSIKQLNQLIILRNFTTLILKGYGWIEASFEIANVWHDAIEPSPYFARRVQALARYYQVFENLPQERRGGSRHGRSLLNDESVQAAIRTWLTSQAIGSVTPRLFAEGINSTILPSLDIMVKKPVCEWTARRWLVQLGWTHQTLRKGVYMDGHERLDVVKYHEEVFLPKLSAYERQMVKFELEDGMLCPVQPDLQPGERIIIPQWQDETCFQANKFKKNLWCVLQ